ncbi:T9SS type A sorting domain-containing protein [Sinomicrobium weinanense]|uniref:T9SS type A sorting domain-containing protein n=1 Tax=Sinomicrobium weinanense TaxID=2842200 RepID=A0A926JUX9_9FLAO|nr:T9SS type A sorting domain-containing protein [Sinomicrobium weinanense]MBC9798030.1 T9SS type A sorting domain-containing protein [Sinomicrobium weinanense]MBU3125859.1 T9SS type A sorting domain-containing protein [Sinomicrobium weinanense]
MKKNYELIVLFFSLLAGSCYAQNNTIVLDPLPGGSEGNTRYTDASTLQTDASGTVSYYNSNSYDDWSVTATTVTPTGALDKTFAITFGGMAGVNTTEGNDFGEMTSPGGIDRASDGALGIRGGIGNGIDSGEGFYFGLDLTNLNSTAAVQITKIAVAHLSDPGETGMIVSRKNPLKRFTFGNPGAPGVDYELSNGAGVIDVSSFNLYVTGGEVNESLVSVFSNTTVSSAFRITQVELKVLTNIFNPAVIENKPHPRLLLKPGEESEIQSLVNQSGEFNAIHSYILEQADAFTQASPLTYNPSNNRLLATARKAIKQIFYLAYAYRVTGQASYLTKAEEVINTVCDFPDWVTYSLDTAEMCFAVALGYDWLYNDLAAATKQNAREAILNYAFLTQKNKPFWDMTSNWNQVCIGGLAYGALAIYGDGTTQMNQEAKFILNNIAVKNPNSMNTYAGGNYQEGPMYWSYGTTYEVLLLSALEGIYGQNHETTNRLTYTPGFLESAEYMQYVTGTSSLYFNYSDCTEKRVPLPATLWMAGKAGNPSLLTVEKELMKNGRYASDYSDDSRFLPIALVYGKEIDMNNLAPPQSKMWNGYGEQPIVLVRTDWQGPNGKYMGVKGGTPTYSHAQMDGGSFVYDSQGLRWGMDFGKYDYEAVKAGIDPPGSTNDFSQGSSRWDIFRVSNLNHNTLSIKKSSDSEWQHHKAGGHATIGQIYDTPAKRGARVHLKDLIDLNNNLDAIHRSIYLVDESYLEIKDFINNKGQSMDIYWNMVTTALVETVSPSKLKLTQGGKTVELEIVSSNPLVTFTLADNRSTDPVDYFPSATYERKNPGTVMVGFEATVPAHENVTFTVTLKDGAEVPPSTAEPVNNILLEVPDPNTGREANALYYDTSEFHIDAQGNVGIGGISTDYAWTVYGTTDIDSVFGKPFFFRWHGMGTTNTGEGTNYGALLSEAGIDRSSTGELGIRGGPSNGIDPGEGYRVGFDCSDLPGSADLQLIKVGIRFAGGEETGMIVNRNDTSKRISFGGDLSAADVILPSGTGFVDVENLDINISGGQTDFDLASIFNTSASGSYRVDKFVFKLISTGASPLSEGSGTSAFKTTESDVIVYPNPSAGHITLHHIREGAKQARVKLFTNSGTCLLDKTYNFSSGSHTMTLSLQHIKPGIYLVQVTDDFGTVTTKKIIRN